MTLVTEVVGVEDREGSQRDLHRWTGAFQERAFLRGQIVWAGPCRPWGDPAV